MTDWHLFKHCSSSWLLQANYPICGERSLAHTSDEIRREQKKGFLVYQCTSLDGFSSTHRSTDSTKDETRSIWCQKWSQISKIRWNLLVWIPYDNSGGCYQLIKKKTIRNYYSLNSHVNFHF